MEVYLDIIHEFLSILYSIAISPWRVYFKTLTSAFHFSLYIYHYKNKIKS